MSIQPYYFNIAINQLAGAAPNDGFVDNNSSVFYIQNNGTDLGTGWAMDLAHAQAKARANIRWSSVLQQLELQATPYLVCSIVATGADQNTPASVFSFSVAYQDVEPLNTLDETAASPTYLTGAAAIKRFVARALTNNITTNYMVMDPSIVGSNQCHYGPSTQVIIAGAAAASIPVAEAQITVTQVPNTF